MFKFKLPPKEPIFVELEGVDINVDYIKDRSLTYEQYQTVRTNTKGFRALIPKLNDEALELVTKHYQNSATPSRGITYDDAIIYVIVPELLKRLKKSKLSVVSDNVVEYETEYKGSRYKFEDNGTVVSVCVNGKMWGSPQGDHFFRALLADIKRLQEARHGDKTPD